jgi:hypothetical protein
VRRPGSWTSAGVAAFTLSLSLIPKLPGCGSGGWCAEDVEDWRRGSEEQVSELPGYGSGGLRAQRMWKTGGEEVKIKAEQNKTEASDDTVQIMDLQLVHFMMKILTFWVRFRL